MRSVRLTPEQERRLAEAAKRTGRPASDIIREAVTEKCDSILSDNLAARLGDLIGSVQGDGKSNARDSSRIFADDLAAKHKARQARRK